MVKIPKETILVTDDSWEIRHFLSDTLLEPAGYRVLMADNGSTAIRLAKEHNPDLVLLDINLPDISGLDVLRALRSEQNPIPVIMITSLTEPAIILKSFRLGARDYLQKPFAVEDVLSAIDKVLSEARWQREREQITAALDNANRELREQVKVWEALDKVGRAITATLNEKDAQRKLMEGINQVMRVEAGSLFLVDESTGELVLTVSLRGKLEKMLDVRLAPGQGVAGWVLQHRRPLLLTDAYNDERFFPDVDQRYTGFLTRSILAVPLIVHGKAIGVIQVLNPIGEKTHFEPNDLQALEALAASVAVAVENARLYEQMRVSVTANTLEKTVTTLSHHINNSLTVIIMLADLLQEKVEDLPPKVRPLWLTKAVKVLRKEAKRIAQVLKVLEQVTDIRETDYAGATKMIDINEKVETSLAEIAQPIRPLQT